MVDFEFNYFGGEEGIEESDEFTDDYERRSVKVNRDGRKDNGDGARTCSGLRKSGKSTILRIMKHQILSRSWIKDVLGNESWSLNI